jgi:hypothetical protein
MLNREQALVGVTAHELFHLLQWHERTRKPFDRPEGHTVWAQNQLAEKFQANRETLMAEWSKESERADDIVPVSGWQRRATKATENLERWQRKFKLVQTKVRKLRARVHYYHRRQAALPGPILNQRSASAFLSKELDSFCRKDSKRAAAECQFQK